MAAIYNPIIQEFGLGTSTLVGNVWMAPEEAMIRIGSQENGTVATLLTHTPGNERAGCPCDTCAEFAARAVDLPTPRPQPVEIRDIGVSLEEYESICTTLGWVPKELKNVRFKNFLQREEIPVYDMKEVEAYLGQKIAKLKKAGNSAAGWYWHPLRGVKKDGMPINGLNWERWVSSAMQTGNGPHGEGNVYTKPVPIEALRDVAKIATAFPEAKFHVAEVGLDPFMSVLHQNEQFVIAVWDEPGFKLVKKDPVGEEKPSDEGTDTAA